MLFSFLRKRLNSGVKMTGQRKPARRFLGYELLEDRIVPAWDLLVNATSGGLAPIVSSGVATFTATATGQHVDINDILTQLTSGNDVVINNGSTGTETGNITWQAASALTWSGGTTHSLQVQFDGSSAAGAALALSSKISVSGAGSVLNLSGVNDDIVHVFSGALIQNGVDFATAGALVSVGAGTYQEFVTVNKALTLHGANFGVSGSSLARTAESIVLANGSNFGSTVGLFSVGSDSVTIDGFTLDGDDTSVVGHTLASGDDANTSYGVRVNGGRAHLTVQNNIIEHVEIGLRGDVAVNSDNIITNNWFDSIGKYDFGYAVSLRNGFYADVTNNKMTRVWTGVHLNNFQTAGPTTWNISNNQIQAYAGGILYWGEFGAATSATIDSNQISAAVGAVSDNFGVLMVSVQNTVSPTFTNNSITGTDYGIGLTNVSTSNVITLGSTNSISGAKKAGVYLTDNLTFDPVGTTILTTDIYTGPSNAIAVKIVGMPITGSLGVGIKVETSRTPGPDVTATVTVTGSTTISGTSGSIGVDVEGASAVLSLTGATVSGFATGIEVDAGTATVTNNSLTSTNTGIDVHNGGGLVSVTGNIITGNANDAIEIESDAGSIGAISSNSLAGNGGLAIDSGIAALIDASANWYGTSTPAGVAAKLGGNLDYTPWLGVGTDTSVATGFQPSFASLWVDDDSAQTGSTGRIQEAIDLLAAGGTVNLAAGTYNENNDAIHIGKSLTITGPNASNSPNTASRVTEAIVTDQGTDMSPNNAFVIEGGSLTVTIQGLTFDGTSAPVNAYSGGDVIGLKKNIFTHLVNTGMFFETPTLTLDDNRWVDITALPEDTVQVGVDDPNTPPAQVTITNNVWTNVTTAALNLSDVAGSISGNQFLDVDYYGILVANGSGNLSITSNLFDGIDNPDPLTSATWGAGVRFYAPSITNPVTVTGNTFQNSYIGVSIRAGANIAGMPINVHDNTFTSDGQAVYQDGTGTLDLTAGNIFDGVDSTTATTEQLFAIEDNIHDGLDEAGKGLVRVRTGSLYVTQNSGSIQRAIDLATSGDTINVAAGTYAENVSTAGTSVKLSAGGSPAQVTINGNLSLDSNDTLILELDGTTAGTQYDQWVVTGSISLGGASLQVSRGFLPGNGTVFTIIDGSSPVTGTLTPDPVNVGGVVLDVGYGSDVTLTVANTGDTFSGPDAGNLGPNWSQKVGRFIVQGQQVVGTAATNLSTFNGLAASTDVTVEALVSVPASTKTVVAGLVARYGGSGDKNYYLGALVGRNGVYTAMILKKLATGGLITLASAPAASFGDLRFDVVGESLKLYFNGVLVARAVDSSIMTAGRVGIRGTVGTNFDNFAAAQIADVVPFADDFDRTPNTYIGDAWTLRGNSDFDIVNGATAGDNLLIGRATGASVALYNDAAELDVSVQADVTLTSGVVGLTAHYIDDADKYVAQLVSSAGGYRIQIEKFVKGKMTLLVNQAAVGSASGTLKFEVVGASLKLSLNGQVLAKVIDNTLRARGLTGVVASKDNTVDNFQVQRVDFAPFTDDFNRSATFTPGDDWTVVSPDPKSPSNFAIQSATPDNVLAATGGSLNLALYNGGSLMNAEVQAEVNLNNKSQAGVVARATSSNTMYVGRVRKSGSQVLLEIVKVVAGKETILKHATVASGSGVLDFKVQNNVLTLKLGAVTISTTDSSISTAGLVGVRGASGTTYDDFSVISA